MVERITSRRSTLRTLPALREEALPRPWAQRMCCGVHTESSADRSEMGKIDRSRRRRGCAGALRHKICTASLDNRPLIDGFVFACTSAEFEPKTIVAHSLIFGCRLALFAPFSNLAVPVAARWHWTAPTTELRKTYSQFAPSRPCSFRHSPVFGDAEPVRQVRQPFQPDLRDGGVRC